MPNGIELIIGDHATVAQLFDDFAAAPKGSTVGQIIDALKDHDEAEHAVLYPFARTLLDDDEGVAAYETAHSAVKRQIDLVCALEGPPLIAAVDQLRALVEDHVLDEEQHLLAALTDAATPDDLEQLGSRLLQAKQRVG